MVVLDSREPFLLGCRDDATVDQESGRTVVIIRRNTEDLITHGIEFELEVVMRRLFREKTLESAVFGLKLNEESESGQPGTCYESATRSLLINC